LLEAQDEGVVEGVGEKPGRVPGAAAEIEHPPTRARPQTDEERPCRGLEDPRDECQALDRGRRVAEAVS
jgi:hypothetical protein